MTYKVFTRDWWRFEEGVKVPYSNARKYTIGCFETEEEAKDCCREGNTNRSKNWIKFGRKYEYTNIG